MGNSHAWNVISTYHMHNQQSPTVEIISLVESGVTHHYSAVSDEIYDTGSTARLHDATYTLRLGHK